MAPGLPTDRSTPPQSTGVSHPGEAGADAAIKNAALDTATEDAQLAAAVGLVAQPRISSRRDAIASDILIVADAVNADVILLGTRGLSGVKSLMLGSVSHAVLHHADRAVLVVPSPSLAEQRHKWGQTPNHSWRHVTRPIQRGSVTDETMDAHAATWLALPRGDLAVSVARGQNASDLGSANRAQAGGLHRWCTWCVCCPADGMAMRIGPS